MFLLIWSKSCYFGCFFKSNKNEKDILYGLCAFNVWRNVLMLQCKGR